MVGSLEEDLFFFKPSFIQGKFTESNALFQKDPDHIHTPAPYADIKGSF